MTSKVREPLQIVDVIKDVLPGSGKSPKRGTTFRAPPLFKYTSLERAQGILSGLEIRMTQPRFLNDPHELGFVINGEALVLDVYKDLIAKGQSHDIAADMAKRLALDIALQRVDDVSRQREEYGVLSLSSTSDNLLMWAHYGNEHAGVAIEIDVDPLMSQVHNTSHLHALIEVSYHAKRIDIVARQTPLWTTLAVKSKPWAYEQEWRLVRSLASVRKKTDVVYVLDLPPDAVKRIIFGAQADPGLEQKIFEMTQADKRLRHVVFEKAWFNSSFTKLNHCSMAEYAEMVLHSDHHFGTNWRKARQWLDLPSFERAENMSSSALKAKAMKPTPRNIRHRK